MGALVSQLVGGCLYAEKAEIAETIFNTETAETAESSCFLCVLRELRVDSFSAASASSTVHVKQQAATLPCGAGSRIPAGRVRLFLEVRAGDEGHVQIGWIVDDRFHDQP